MSLLVAVALALAIAWLVARAIAARQARLVKAGERWTLEEDSDGELVSVFAVHPGKDKLLIGAVPISATDFSQRIEDVRADGHEKVTALNAARPALGR